MNVFIDEIAKQAFERCDAYGIAKPSHREMFACGYREGLKVNPWRKVSEELPKKEAFLVRKIDNPQVYAILIYSHKERGFWNTITGGFITIDGVLEYYTHWMPIPKIKED